MKRLYIFFSLILVLTVLALPAVARADDATAAGWTWDESNAPAVVDGWTWDEA